ncbi:MAG: cation transporter [Anaerolineales bacterium]|nr:cation transporter [Anaerolineales bacterium]
MSSSKPEQESGAIHYVHPNPHDHHHHDHDHDHDHDHHHDHHHHDHHHDHSHDHDHTLWERIASALHIPGYSHEHAQLTSEQAFFDNALGIRTVWLALAILLVTSLLQIGVVALSGSVALLGDTVHNIGDGLNSVPLLIAFYLARRIANRRYNYGYGRAEDVAGIFIILSIAFSAFFIFKESIERFINPQPLTNLGWLAAAAIIGFLGNEAVAVMQIRVGKKIGSAAMIADGLHARTDGLTSLAVLLAAGGTVLGFPIVDPIIGMLIGLTIVFITWDAIKKMWYRLMDAVEPDYLDKAEAVVRRHKLVDTVYRVRMRWVGHRLHAEVNIGVDPRLTTGQSHRIAEELRHDLFHAFPTLAEVLVHVEPWQTLEQARQLTSHHEPPPRLLQMGN